MALAKRKYVTCEAWCFRKEAYVAAGKSAVITYWNIGRRIVKEEQQGKERAEYGAEVIKNLALKIIPRYGASYNKRNLDYYKRFYLLFPDIQLWTHVFTILVGRIYAAYFFVSDPNARLWYLKTADKDMWSFRALDRNISTQYYERRLAAQRENSALPVAKYMTYMPTEEELRNEIEQPKRFFMEQHDSHDL